MSRIKWYILLVIGLLSYNLSSAQLPDFIFQTPGLAGTLRLGLIAGEESIWLKDCKDVKIKKDKVYTTYTVKCKLTGKGSLTIRTRPLNDTRGEVMELIPENLPEHISLLWAFGGSYGQEIENAQNPFAPEYCKDNVFSVEGNAFTVYYGTSRRLRIFHGVMPLNSDIRLSDAYKMESPLQFFNSGKKTDAPALAAICCLKNRESLYFCFYHQNPKADYNYYMLPQLFSTGSATIHKETDWMKSTPD